MDKKKIIVIGAIIAILLSIAVVIYASQKDKNEPEHTIDGIILPTNKEILNDTNVNDLNITNVSLITRNGVSAFKIKVSNNTNKDVKIDKLYVVFYEGDTEQKNLLTYDTTISAGSERNLEVISEIDLTNTTKIEYVLEQ